MHDVQVFASEITVQLMIKSIQFTLALKLHNSCAESDVHWSNQHMHALVCGLRLTITQSRLVKSTIRCQRSQFIRIMQ